MDVLRLPEFREWSYKACDICKKVMFYRDMVSHFEFSKEKSADGCVRIESVHLCRSCNRRYVHMKDAINDGYTKKGYFESSNQN